MKRPESFFVEGIEYEYSFPDLAENQPGSLTREEAIQIHQVCKNKNIPMSPFDRLIGLPVASEDIPANSLFKRGVVGVYLRADRPKQPFVFA